VCCLAHINRFTGHTVRPLSVAEHSVMVCHIMEAHLGITSPTGLLAGLMHDAHEFIVGDITSPVKDVLGMAWRQIDFQAKHAVQSRFGLQTAYLTHRAVIKQADLMALSAERQQLMPEGRMWPCEETHPAPACATYCKNIDLTPDHWRCYFLSRFNTLSAQAKAQAQALGQSLAFIPASQGL
jgi:5'-deoxynucleotidase YfbR-like HD superfamily hydrolase